MAPDGPTTETATRDISGGGLRLARAGFACERGDVVEVVIEAAQANLRIEAEAEAVRVTDDDISLRFTRIEPALGRAAPADRARLLPVAVPGVAISPPPPVSANPLKRVAFELRAERRSGGLPPGDTMPEHRAARGR